MARIRTVKPGFFKHSELFDAEVETGLPLRLGYAGLWVCCDREGRFKWRPRELKLDALPFDTCDFSRVLDALESRGFLVKYESEGEVYGYVPTWHKHQFINNRESVSGLPEPPSIQSIDASITRIVRVDHESDTCLEGKEIREGDKGKEGDARERATAPLSRPVLLSRSAGADGEFIAATGLMQELKLAATAGDIRVMAQVIMLEAPERGGVEAATDWLRDRAIDARTRGESVNIFWFKDRKFDKGKRTSQEWDTFVAEGGTRDDEK